METEETVSSQDTSASRRGSYRLATSTPSSQDYFADDEMSQQAFPLHRLPTLPDLVLKERPFPSRKVMLPSPASFVCSTPCSCCSSSTASEIDISDIHHQDTIHMLMTNAIEDEVAQIYHPQDSLINGVTPKNNLPSPKNSPPRPQNGSNDAKNCGLSDSVPKNKSTQKKSYFPQKGPKMVHCRGNWPKKELYDLFRCNREVYDHLGKLMQFGITKEGGITALIEFEDRTYPLLLERAVYCDNREKCEFLEPVKYDWNQLIEMRQTHFPHVERNYGMNTHKNLQEVSKIGRWANHEASSTKKTQSVK